MASGAGASEKDPRILLVGATGPSGRAILARASSEQLGMRALVRNPAAPGNAANAVRGDVLDRASLVRAMTGIETVVSVLGTKLTMKRVSLLSDGTHNIVEAMREVGARRLLCVTGMGAGESRGHGGFVYDRLILNTLLRNIYADKNRQEHVVKSSGLDWVLIRPARLVDTASTGRYREITAFADERMTTISRADVAHFVVRELTRLRYSRQTVNLTY